MFDIRLMLALAAPNESTHAVPPVPLPPLPQEKHSPPFDALPDASMVANPTIDILPLAAVA